jgi:hypothetical protein
VLNAIGPRSPARFVVGGKGDALGVRAQGIGSPATTKGPQTIGQ